MKTTPKFGPRETWERTSRGIDWGTRKPIEILARSATHVLMYRYGGTGYGGRFTGSVYNKAELSIRRVDDLMREVQVLPSSRLNDAAIKDNQKAIDKTFGKTDTFTACYHIRLALADKQTALFGVLPDGHPMEAVEILRKLTSVSASRYDHSVGELCDIIGNYKHYAADFLRRYAKFSGKS